MNKNDISCPHKLDTHYSKSMCALRYRNAQLEKCINPNTKPGFKDPFCKSCLIGKELNIIDIDTKSSDETLTPAPLKEPLRIPQGRTINTDSNITIDRNREYILDGVKLFAIVNLKGRNTNSPRLANDIGEIVAKICNACFEPKWLTDYYNQDHPCLCKKCQNKKPKKKKVGIPVEDKEFVKSSVDIVPEVIKEKTGNIVDLKMIALEKTLIEIIDKRFEELKKNILFEIGTALLLEAKK